MPDVPVRCSCCPNYSTNASDKTRQYIFIPKQSFYVPPGHCIPTEAWNLCPLRYTQHSKFRTYLAQGWLQKCILLQDMSYDSARNKAGPVTQELFSCRRKEPLALLLMHSHLLSSKMCTAKKWMLPWESQHKYLQMWRMLYYVGPKVPLA